MRPPNIFLSACLALLFLCLTLGAQSEVRAWTELLVIPTYLVEPPDPNPIFFTGRAYQGAKGPVYPYPFFDRLTDERVDKSYRAVYLENEYVKICVLPEIGGRIFSALDKTNNYDYIYRQHVIKPALIGMLGAWISGGVEWNIPHHHRASTFMSVDNTIARNRDGSATVWVGEIELRHRMKWLVGLTLKPGRSCLEVTMKIINRTPLAHSMLAWANVAVHANPDYQVIFPPDVEFATFHGKNQFSRWPVSTQVYNRQDYSKGTDVSWWKSHGAPTSFFAWEARSDFLAGYDHGKDAGVAFVADHAFVPGKKLWTWGTGSEGRLWEKILTDADGPYAELMIGAFSDNQPDYSWIQPYEVRTVTEWWYPIRNIGGVKAANEKAACALMVMDKQTARIGFHPTSELPAVRAILTSAGKSIFEETFAAGPGRPYLKEVVLPSGAQEEDLSLAFAAADGGEIVAYKPTRRSHAPLPPVVTPPSAPKDVPTVEELYLTGLRLEQFYNPAVEPYPYYAEALRRDPGDYRTNTALGLTFIKRGIYAEAEACLRKAIGRATENYTRPKDGEALYYLGVALRAQKKDGEAEDAFSRAAWNQAWRAASFQQLAEIAGTKGDLKKSLELAEASLETNILNPKALGFKSALLRKGGKLGDASATAVKAWELDSLDFWARNEIYLFKKIAGTQDEAGRSLKNLMTLMRDAPANYLELAADYAAGGLWDEAGAVLERLVELKKKGSSDCPLLYYFLGYVCSKRGDAAKASGYLKMAEAMPPDYGFPFQAEFADILRWAAHENPKDARAPYYLGNYLFDLQPELAIAEWEKSAALDPVFSIAQRNLGLAYARVKNDVPAAIVRLEKAVAANPKDPRLFVELDQMYEAGRASPRKRLVLLEKNQAVIEKRDDGLTREIQLLVQTGRYDRAIELLSSHHFHVWEGGGGIHGIFVEAHLLRGQERFDAGNYREALKDFETALTYPANLEVGEPAGGGGSAKIDYLLGSALEALGEKNRAMEAYEKASRFRRDWAESTFYQGLAFRKLGNSSGADLCFEELIRGAERRLQAAPAMDFFEKFGEKQSAAIQNAQAHFLLGLGYQGKGQKAEARAEFEKALDLNICHVGAARQLEKLKS
jgi:tetratricopeptide (TPR) repeat protein